MDIAEQIRTDPDAGARSLMADFGPGLHAFALQLCGNRADADDLYMRTMETALARIGEQRGPSFAAWLRSICANLRRMDLRRGGVPVVEAEVLERIPDERASPAEEAGARSDADAVRDAISRLPSRRHAMILLRYWGGLSQREVASCLGVSEGTVKRFLSEARAFLRNELRRLMEGGAK